MASAGAERVASTLIVDLEPLHSQPEWCRVTLASIGDAVITTDTSGHVTFLNSVAESLTGWTQLAAAGVALDRVFNIINQGTRAMVESPTVRALRDGVIVGLANHTLLISKDGTERPIDDSAAPIRNDKNEVAGVVLVFRDITERYRQERVLAEASEYADNIIATLRHPFLVLDSALRVVTANRAFYQNFHVTPAESEGQFIYDLGDRQWDIPNLRTLLEEVLPQNLDFQDFDVEHDFPTIGRKFMQLNARRILKPGNHSELILLAIEDITAHKIAEEALQQSEVRYRRLFESAKDGILILDARTMRVIDANPFMTELLGYSRADFLGKELWEIGMFSDKAASQATYCELHDHGFVRYDHLPLETKAGEKAEVEFVCNTYRMDGREVAQCNIRDIGERSRLEKLIREQTEALADLHRRKDEFLAMLSHELRNPLAPIANAVQLLRMQPNVPPIQAQARILIERQLAQLTRLVDDLMEVSRITTGRVQLRLEKIDAVAVVERAIDTARPLIDRHKHELSVSLPSEPIWLHADAARLEQVVVNLLTNAAKYTVDGGRISVELRTVGAECELRVSDTGVGILPELLPRIFDLFTQAERSLDRSQGGLGIGLALVQRLVEMHKGRVEARSALGVGSEFAVHLPLAHSPGPVEVSIPVAAIGETGPSLRVLVVDDNEDAAESLAMLLQSRGHDARMAFTGPAGVQAALDYLPHAILLDIGLPTLDGYEVAKRIRKQPGGAAILLIALTGYGQVSDRQQSLDAGFDHHLVKPTDFSKVQEILATVKSI